MPASSRLSQPLHYSDALLFRINRLRAVGGGLVLRYCEGQFGVTRREWVMIALLADVACVSSSELARLSEMDKSATSKAVTALLTKGLVERTHRAGDRRFIELALSESGRNLYNRILPVVSGINQEIMNGLTQQEVHVLDNLLTRMQKNVEKLRDRSIDLPRVARGHGGTRHQHSSIE